MGATDTETVFYWQQAIVRHAVCLLLCFYIMNIARNVIPNYTRYQFNKQ